MSSIKKISLISIVIASVLIGTHLIQKQKTIDNNELLKIDIDKDSVYEKIESKTEIKKVKFNSAEEMLEYSNKVSKIEGIEEAETFIKKFLQESSSNSPEIMLTYFDSSLWDAILENNMFPFYDPSGLVHFEARDIVVSETKENLVYKVEYTVVAKDTETDIQIAELTRKDTIELYKDFETISIINYTRKTLKEKYN